MLRVEIIGSPAAVARFGAFLSAGLREYEASGYVGDVDA